HRLGIGAGAGLGRTAWRPRLDGKRIRPRLLGVRQLAGQAGKCRGGGLILSPHFRDNIGLAHLHVRLKRVLNGSVSCLTRAAEETKRMRARLGFAVLGLVLNFAGAAMADGEPPVVHATPAMWTVHGPKGTAYLLGSVHALPDNIEWQTPQIMDAIRKSGTFVFEVPMQLDDRERAGRLLGENMLLPISTSLPSYFDSEMRGEWNAAII